MKKLLLVCVVALATAAYAAGSGTAVDVSHREGPPCANITGSDFGYGPTATGSRVAGSILLAAEPCPGSTYTLFVITGFDEDGNPIVVSDNMPNNPSPDPQDPTNPLRLYFEIALPSADEGSTVCVWVETTYRGRIADRGPDSGCETLVFNEPPGGGGFD